MEDSTRAVICDSSRRLATSRSRKVAANSGEKAGWAADAVAISTSWNFRGRKYRPIAEVPSCGIAELWPAQKCRSPNGSPPIAHAELRDCRIAGGPEDCRSAGLRNCRIAGGPEDCRSAELRNCRIAASQDVPFRE